MALCAAGHAEVQSSQPAANPHLGDPRVAVVQAVQLRVHVDAYVVVIQRHTDVECSNHRHLVPATQVKSAFRMQISAKSCSLRHIGANTSLCK